MDFISQPLYVLQLREALEAFKPGRRDEPEQLVKVVHLLMRNAKTADGTDKQLDWYSVAVFETVAHNNLPGTLEGMPPDPGVIEKYEQQFAQDFPSLWRPRIVEKQFHDWLAHTYQPMPIVSDSCEEYLLLAFFARVIVVSYMLEDFDGDVDRGYEQLVDEYMLLGALRLRDYQEQGAFLPEWELPSVL